MIMVNVRVKSINVTRNNSENYKLSYWELDSGSTGPRILVTGAMHGNEVQSPEIIRRFKEIAEAKLCSGSCLLVPFANPVAVHDRHAHIDFETGRRYSRDRVNNLNCSWPGDAEGSDTQRLSFAIFNSELVQSSTHLIDLHCWQSMMETCAIVRRDKPESVGMGNASKLPYLKYDSALKSKEKPEFPCILDQCFSDSGRPKVTVEFSGQFMTHHRVLKHGERALLNIFKYLNMLEGEIEGPDDAPYLILDDAESYEVCAPGDGLFVKSNCKLNDKVAKGDLLGHIFNEKTLEKQDVLAPVAGRLFRYGRQSDSLPCADPLTAYHVYAEQGDVLALIYPG